MIKIVDVIDYYSYFYRKKYNKKDIIKFNKTNIDLVSRFINELDKAYNINTIGHSFLFKYFLFQFMDLETMEISSLNKKLRLNMIIGKPAIKRWFERNKDFDWLLEISNNDYITKYNILRSDLVKKEQKEVKPSSFEERIKNIFYNTSKGYLICITQTTMFDKRHICCLTCNFKNECKKIQKLNYPNIYNERNK